MCLPRTCRGMWIGQARMHQERCSERFQNTPDKERSESILKFDKVLLKVCIGLCQYSCLSHRFDRKPGTKQSGMETATPTSLWQAQGLPTRKTDLSLSRLHWEVLADRGVGAVLNQKRSDGKDHPMAFYSWKLPPRELKYSTTGRKCLAIVNSLKHFAVYLLGHFHVQTDHGALKYLSSMKNSNGRLTR